MRTRDDEQPSDHPAEGHEHAAEPHDHGPEGHDHGAEGHEHAAEPHEHAAEPHEHGPEGHEHAAEPHDHAAEPHEHEPEGHEHAAEPHDHGPEGHDHDHEHPHEHGPTGSGLRAATLRFLGSVIGHSHDHSDSVDAALTADTRGIRAVKVSLAALMLTALAQLAVVAISGSVALFADTVHNFADALTSVPLWIAFVLGRRAATRRYTFGYKRAEDLAGLFVLLMIFGSAVLAAVESIDRLVHPQAVNAIGVVIVAGIIGFAGNELVALYRLRVGRQIGSAALVADGYHARTDGLTSLAVVAGAIGVAAGFPLADPIVGLLISAVILVVLKQAAGQMLGRLMDAVDPVLVDRVEAVAHATPGVQDVGSIRLRWVGHALEATLAITVDRDLSVAQGHAVAEEVQHRLLHQLHRLEVVLIHVNPCQHAGDDPHALTRHHFGTDDLGGDVPVEGGSPSGVATPARSWAAH